MQSLTASRKAAEQLPARRDGDDEPTVSSRSLELSKQGLAGVVERRRLFDRLDDALSGRVTVVSAPPGSGKTFLLRTWLRTTGRAAAWVGVQRHERDAQRFWRSVIEALDRTAPEVVQREGFAQTPQFDGDATVAVLLSKLNGLTGSVLLIIDDLHELVSHEALAQLRLLIEHQPAGLHVVLATHHDPKIGLHRLRLMGQLTEIRSSDLRFSAEESHALLSACGITLSDAAAASLHEQTEGWAAGVRLAALSLTGHTAPERFVAEFSGRERTVADYLLAEVLDRQSPGVRDLLLRTSVLERLNGSLADAVTGSMGGEGTLQALEEAGAFVVALDASRSWFRYHYLFADLLRSEFRRTHPDGVPQSYATAARWFADHGYPVEAVAHAQAGGDRPYAIGLLTEHYFTLSLDGRHATAQKMLASFPLDQEAPDPELAAVTAADHLAHGSLTEAAANIAIAEQHAERVPAARRPRFEASLALARLSMARRRGDFSSVLEQTPSLRTAASPSSYLEHALNNDLRALALMNLGIVEAWSGRPKDAAVHLEQARELAHSIGRPYIEVSCLAHSASTATHLSFARAQATCRAAMAIAEAAGWGDDPVIAPALVKLGACLTHTGSFEEAERCLDRAERTLRADIEPAVEFVLHAVRGALHAARGRDEDAIVSYRRAQRMRTALADGPPLDLQIRCAILDAKIRLGQTSTVEETLVELDDTEFDTGEARATLAHLALAGDDPRAALDILGPVLNDTAPVHHGGVVVRSLVLSAGAYDRLGDSEAMRVALERALDLAEPDRLVLPFAHTLSRALLERHPRHHTAHAAFVAEILDTLSGNFPPSEPADVANAITNLTHTELRVLRFLPSNLPAPQIAAQLYISINTVKTHMRQIYAKLGAHSRTEAVQRARGNGSTRTADTPVLSRIPVKCGGPEASMRGYMSCGPS